ncbi:MAG: zinc-dependent alcohol dehydrogenase family protein [Candidatus Sumerlaeaceae bacterium]|nr:zinc-dependent alcohol dehydrogenase family protein [Candidatus Sumerlaeaceae bacterium]
MQIVTVEAFGGTENLRVDQRPTPSPGPGQVRVKVTSIGLNHADLMARRGEYRLVSGDPPFTPGIEAGGLVDCLGEGVTSVSAGQRVILGPHAPRRAPGMTSDVGGGTYRSHYICAAEDVVPAPDAIADDQLGAIWLPYLTAWGCLVWKQNLKPGQFVAIPAASSSVGLAAGQVARHCGAVPIGMTTSASKVEALKAMPEFDFAHLVVTRDQSGKQTSWHRDLKRITGGRGVDAFFDPVAAGEFLDMEIRALAQFGTIWVYGLLGEPGKVDVTPLIRKHAAIRGWVLGEIVAAGNPPLSDALAAILKGFETGVYRQRTAKSFPLSRVREAHEEMEKGNHIGKLVLVPDSHE